MRLNGKHITDYNATLLDRNISANRVSLNASWDYMQDRPYFYGASLEFKDVLLYLLVEASTEEQFLKTMGEISEVFRKGAKVVFDDINLTYTFYLKQKPEYTKLNPTSYRLDFVLEGDYGVNDAKSVVGDTSLSVTNDGVYPTPVRLTIKVPAMQSSFKITGFNHDIVLVNTPTDATIEIDSQEGTIMVNGSNGIEHMKSFYFPRLNVGTSQIQSTANCSITITYSERF